MELKEILKSIKSKVVEIERKKPKPSYKSLFNFKKKSK
jgi:hypothetical protein